MTRRIQRAARGAALAAAAAILAPVPAVAEDASLSVRVTPKYCREPCPVMMIIGLDPNEADRELTVEADSFKFYRSSLIQLEGEDEPSVHRLLWKNLPAGNYEIRVTLKRATGEERQIASDVRVF